MRDRLTAKLVGTLGIAFLGLSLDATVGATAPHTAAGLLWVLLAGTAIGFLSGVLIVILWMEP